MPMLEVLRSANDRLEPEKKRAFAKGAIKIFRKGIGTPPGRQRFFFLEMPRNEGLEEVLDGNPDD
jgi:hypothetical protein